MNNCSIIALLFIMLFLFTCMCMKTGFMETFNFKYADRQCAWELVGTGKQVNHPDRFWKLQKLRGQNKYRVFAPHMTSAYEVKNSGTLKNGDIISLTLRPDIQLVVELGPVSSWYPKL